jgi:hypothetical protein
MVGKARFRAMAAALESAGKGNVIGLDLELVYGHCWSAGLQARDGEYRIDAARIPRRR